MFLELRDQGIYVSHVPAWANALAAYLDFPWFVALTGWGLGLMLWWWRPRHASLVAWGWLPWSASGGVLITLLHLAHLVFSRVEATPNGPFLAGDLLLGALGGLIAAGWWYTAADTPRARKLCLPIAILLLSFAALRTDFWTAQFPSSVLAAASLLAALPWCLRRDATAWSRAAVVVAALLPLCSTVGPISYAFSMIERYTALNPAGFITASSQALAAWLALVGFSAAILASFTAAERRALHRDVRPFVFGGVAWAALMFTAAILVGERQRQRTNERALEQVRVPASKFNSTVLAPVAGDRFQLDDILPANRAKNAPIRTGWSDYLATGAANAADRAIDEIAAVSRTALYVRFITLRSGWLGSPFNHHTAREGWVKRLSRSVGKGEGRVLLLRQPTPADQLAWTTKAEHIEGPLVSPIMANSHVFVRAPVVDAAGAMLGWLEFTHMADTFFAETIQARVAPLLGLTLGSIVAGLFFVQHRQARARESALRAATLAAEADRLKTTFLAKVSHELRTPLQSITGYSALLDAEISTTAGRARLAALRQHGDLMLRLVNDLLDLGALESGEFRLLEKPTPVVELIRATVDSLRPRAEAKSLALAFTASSDLPAWANTDAERLRQIVLNLVGNAVKFTAQGRIDVALRLTSPTAENSPTLELTVTDTGPGIPAEEREKLFRPFSRLTLAAPHEGAGLGLALSAALCRTFGGTLDVESDGRTGSCFHARLPLRPCAAPAANSPTALPTLAGLRVLIADDNALIRQLFTAYLAELGAVVESVVDGTQALARATAETFDVLILDFAMPGLDGPSVARHLRAAHHTLRIVGVSAHASATVESEARTAGMDAFLAKPVDLAALASALAPSVNIVAPTTRSEKFAALHAALAAEFRASLLTEISAIEAALARHDWPTLQRLAHRLMNSAGVVQDTALYDACAALENSSDPPTANIAWQKCLSALAPWRKPITPLAGWSV